MILGFRFPDLTQTEAKCNVAETSENATSSIQTAARPIQHPPWWSIARTEGEKWYAEQLKPKKEDDPPITQKAIAAHLDEYLFKKGFRSRGGNRISRSSILEQIKGIAKRQKIGMEWK